MYKVNQPTVDDKQFYDEITTAKTKEWCKHLQGARELVFTAYDAYAAAAPDFVHLPSVSLTDEQKNALVHAYEVETKPMASLRELLMRPVSVARCPFCGISEASTLDHYLPKEQYPQFAVHSQNLVPCCSHCNTRKGKQFLNIETGDRLFLHPYFDTVPEGQFVSLTITLGADTLSLAYSPQQPHGMAKLVFQRLKSHFGLLHLADRYRKMSLEYLRGQREALNRFYGPSANAKRVAAELANQANDYERDLGPNHWRVILHRGLAAHGEFCDGGFQVLNEIQ